MKNVQIILILSSFLFTQCSPASKTGSNTVDDVSQLINSKNYTFLAQYAQPLGGRQISLNTTDYSFTIRNDSLISYLPYFGQAYVAPMNPSDAGIQFTSTNFDYTATPTRKGGYTISIKPREEPKANLIIINITSAGYASLQVTSTNRQSISFRGVMQKPGK